MAGIQPLLLVSPCSREAVLRNANGHCRIGTARNSDSSNKSLSLCFAGNILLLLNEGARAGILPAKDGGRGESGKIRSASSWGCLLRQALLPQVGGDGVGRKGKNTALPVVLLADGSL